MDRKRNEANGQLAADRLLGAADVLLAARGRGNESEAFVDAWLGGTDPAGGGQRPFSYDELVEGMCFLIRCGLVEPSAPAGQRDRPRRHPSH